jgi:predicted enzyme related to lactoylglutathione lyase
MAGEIVHIEIAADDIEQARAFWGSLFGWDFNAFPGPKEYHLFAIEKDRAGGAITNMEEGKKGTPPYFAVDDINAGAARVQELGGKAGDAMPVPSMGWFATCTDPHGNEFGLWQADPVGAEPDLNRTCRTGPGNGLGRDRRLLRHAVVSSAPCEFAQSLVWTPERTSP